MDTATNLVHLQRELQNAHTHITALNSVIREQDDYLHWLTREYETLNSRYETLLRATRTHNGSHAP